jgi:hypothetical protein
MEANNKNVYDANSDGLRRFFGVGVEVGVGAVERLWLWLWLCSHRVLKARLYKNKNGVLHWKKT